MDDEKNKLIDALSEAISSNPQAEAIFNSMIADDETHQKDSYQKEETKKDSGIDLSMILKLNQVMSGLKSAEDDDRSRLLSAIRPFLNEDRKGAVDSAIKLLKITSLFRLARDLDLFKDFKF